MGNNVVNPTAADVGKIQQDMNTMQVRFKKISSADFEGTFSSKPWKPEVTPPRRRGGFNRGRGGRQFDNMQKSDRFKNNDILMATKMGIITREMGIILLEIEDKAEEILEVLCLVKVGRGRFDKSTNVRHPRAASKTVDKNKIRCHYCNKLGHFIRECSKRNKDEEEA